MAKPISERRLIENQVVFRQQNERVQEGLKQLENLAKKEGQQALVGKIKIPLYFICECSNIRCRERILLPPYAYVKVHKQRDRFIIKPGHEIKQIEKVVVKNKDYCVVEKFKQPPARVNRTLSTKKGLHL